MFWPTCALSFQAWNLFKFCLLICSTTVIILQKPTIATQMLFKNLKLNISKCVNIRLRETPSWGSYRLRPSIADSRKRNVVKHVLPWLTSLYWMLASKINMNVPQRSTIFKSSWDEHPSRASDHENIQTLFDGTIRPVPTCVSRHGERGGGGG